MLKIIIDTNVIIAAEPSLLREIDPNAYQAATLYSLASRHAEIYVHPAQELDFQAVSDPEFRAKRLAAFKKYTPLPHAPEAAVAASRDNKWVDSCLLQAAQQKAIDFVVTEDAPLRARFALAGLSHAALTIEDALTIVRALAPATPRDHPGVALRPAHNIKLDDPILAPLRQSYPDFDLWLDRQRKGARPCLLIRDDATDYLAGLIIFKVRELDDPPPEATPPVAKLCAIVVSPQHRGRRLVELLLKHAIRHLQTLHSASAFVTLFADRQEPLRLTLEDLGFQHSAATTPLGEAVMWKELAPPPVLPPLDPLLEHILYGPPHFRLAGVDGYMVPVEPRWHARLFPDADPKPHLFPTAEPSSNGIRKAYLCGSPITTLRPGDVLGFYQSRPAQSVATVGIVEDHARLGDVAEVTRFVGTRTVYTSQDLVQMLDKHGEVLCIRFRHAKNLRSPLPLSRLRELGLKGPPQTIQRCSATILQELHSSPAMLS